MGNMSYCRFENTCNDMSDCINALEEAEWDLEEMINKASSQYEANAMKRFILMCNKVSNASVDMESDFLSEIVD